MGSGRFCRSRRVHRCGGRGLRLASRRPGRPPAGWRPVNPVLALVLAAAVGASFSSRIEVVAAAAVVACSVAWIADRDSFRRVLRVGLVLGAVFAAAAATAAVAWASGLDRGLMIGGTVLLRLVVLGTAAAVVTRSVDAETIMRMTSRFGMERLGLVFGLALNALPHLSETASTVWAAHRVRSGGRWAALRRFPALAEVLLAHTSRVADQAAAAAALRGHTALSRTSRRWRPDANRGDHRPDRQRQDAAGELGGRRARPSRHSGRGFPPTGHHRRRQRRSGFRVQDAATGESLDLARRVAPGEGAFGTSFEFFDEGFDLGRRALAISHRARSSSSMNWVRSNSAAAVTGRRWSGRSSPPIWRVSSWSCGGPWSRHWSRPSMPPMSSWWIWRRSWIRWADRRRAWEVPGETKFTICALDDASQPASIAERDC